MTKPMHEEPLSKLPLSLDEVQANMKILNSGSIGLCTSRGRSLRPTEAPALVKSRTRPTAVKTRLGKIMHRLHNLETDNLTEKKLNVDLDIDLYQMENY